LIRQQLGLAVSPIQQLTAENALAALAPEIMTAQARTSEADTKAKAEARLQKEFATLDPEEQATMFDTNLKTMALTGFNVLGQKIPPAMQQQAFNIIRKSNEIPGLNTFIQGLIASGDFANAARVLGGSEEEIKASFGFAFTDAFDTITPGLAQELSQGGAPIGPGVANQKLQEFLDQSTKDMVDKFKGILDTLPDQ
jgi:hypothetical protein